MGRPRSALTRASSHPDPQLRKMGNYKAGLVWRADPVSFLRACSPEGVGFFSSFELKSFIGKVVDEQGESRSRLCLKNSWFILLTVTQFGHRVWPLLIRFLPSN